ncbi:MAG: polysaccharide pyruvyl transferase family protein [Alphaproteobacteria bacterium]|nr:polysaccharide pyruvyl transferase family protein [Alphaproteobacteria bacterium]
MSRKITIALVWHSMNSDNLGVGALTLSNIAILREAAKEQGLTPHFLVLGWRDPRPWYGEWDDVENIPLRTRHLPAPGGPLGAALARADIVFDIGGGDSFTDIYGTKRFLTVWGTKLRTILAGKPLVLSPQTVGPFETAWARRLARGVMNRAKFVVTRDAPSTQFVSDMGITARVLEATDVAMGLPYDLPTAREGSGPVRVGLNVSGLLFNGGYTQSNQFGLKSDYASVIRQIIEGFLQMPEVELHLVGHVQSEAQPVEDDQRVSEELGREYQGVVVAPVFASPTDAKSYIAGMDFFIGARMHAAIAAFSSGVPVVPMAYSRKFQGVFGTLGYPHVANCKADSAEEIIDRVMSGYANRVALADEVATSMQAINARLYAYRDMAGIEMVAALAR